jgi:hypothetical protein
VITGIDIAEVRSEHLKECIDQNVNDVITVGGAAKEFCPVFLR